MTALTLCVSAAQKARSVEEQHEEARCGKESATVASIVLTDLALLEQSHQSLTIHLDQITEQLALGNTEGKRGRLQGLGGEKEKAKDEQSGSRKICCGAYKNLGPSFSLSLIAPQEFPRLSTCIPVVLLHRDPGHSCGGHVKCFQTNWLASTSPPSCVQIHLVSGQLEYCQGSL